MFDRAVLWRLVATGRARGQSQGSPSPCWSHRNTARSHLCTRISLLHDDMQLTDIVCSGAVRRDGIDTICVVRYLRLAHRCWWRSKYFGKWHCVLGCVISEVSKFQATAVQEERDCLSPADEETTRAHRLGALEFGRCWCCCQLRCFVLC